VPDHGTRTKYIKGCRCDDCKAAGSEYGRKWYAANRDKERARSRKYEEANPERRRNYYAANRDRARENARKWAEANPDRARENVRKWHEANPDRALENTRKWVEANPDKRREISRKGSNVRRARKRGVFVEDVDPQAVFERDEWTCHICGEFVDPKLKHPNPLSASLDHIIPLAKGGEHSYDNCATSHLQCNVRKQAKMPA
jgi:5-methylcytosine-specific restriction endonuclease McrA